MARSKKPSVYIDPRRSKGGYTTYRVRREVNGRELPSIPCGTDLARAKKVKARELDKLWNRRVKVRGHAGDDVVTLSVFMAKDETSRLSRVEEKTAYNDQWALRLLKECLGDIPVNEVDGQSIIDFEAWLRKREFRFGPKGTFRRHAHNGVNILLRAVKSALRRAYKQRLIDEDPFLAFEIPPDEDVANPPTDEEIARMWPLIPPLSQKAVGLAGACGFRTSEVLSVETDSFVPPPGIEMRPRTATTWSTPVLTDAPWILHVQKAKTRRGKTEFKDVGVPAAVFFYILPLPAAGALFKMSDRLLLSHLEKARRRAGLGRIRLHDFRHRWATEFMESERDPYSLMQSGGWTAMASTAKYQHGTDERRRANAKAGAKVRIPPPALPADVVVEQEEDAGSST